MAKPQPTYDLMLLLDTAVAPEQRKTILADVEAAIGRGGEIVGTHEWGTRPTAYEIRHKTDAEYHLLQFHATTELLATLHRTLRITDGITRFRIIKLAPGTPGPPDGQIPVATADEPAAAPAAPAA